MISRTYLWQRFNRRHAEVRKGLKEAPGLEDYYFLVYTSGSDEYRELLEINLAAMQTKFRKRLGNYVDDGHIKKNVIVHYILGQISQPSGKAEESEIAIREGTFNITLI